MSRPKKRAVQLLADSLILFTVFMVSMWLRLDRTWFLDEPRFWGAMLIVIPLSLAVFVKLGFYRAVVRYIAGRALGVIFLGALASGIFLSLVSWAMALPVPRSVPLIYTVLTFLCIGGVRFVFREMVAVGQDRRNERVAIYGAGASGRQLLQSLRQSTQYSPIAFLDDALDAQGTHVGGLHVYAPSMIDTLISKKRVSTVLLAVPSTSPARRSEILRTLEKLPVKLRTVPGLEDVMAGRGGESDLTEVKIEDILGRDPVPPIPELLGANTLSKVVMVTGAGGSIGSELCRQILAQRPVRLVLFEQSELALYSIDQELTAAARILGIDAPLITPILGSVQSQSQLERIIRRFKVQTIYHAAAYKHVPMVEQNVVAGLQNNVFGTLASVRAALACGVEAFILVSTDKAVRPTNFMGASKRLAELICQAQAQLPAAHTKISMVRFGNVLGSSGSVIPLFKKQLRLGGPLTVTHADITRYFMTIPEAAQLVLQAGAIAKGGEVFVLDMGEPVKIVELAAQMARLHGLRPVLCADDTAPTVKPGEIAVVINGLRPGEKLYEELLIGNDPQPTCHPRILSAKERCLPEAILQDLLERLDKACKANDVDAARRILEEAQTDFNWKGPSVDLLGRDDASLPVVDAPLGRDDASLPVVDARFSSQTTLADVEMHRRVQ